jgi:hypothetical protein
MLRCPYGKGLACLTVRRAQARVSAVSGHYLRRDIFRVAIDSRIARVVVGALTLATWCAVGTRARALVAAYGFLNDGCPDSEIGRFRRWWERIVNRHDALFARAAGKP